MALAYTAPTWTDGSGEGISASNLQAISNCIEGLVQGSDKAVHHVEINGSVITLTYADGTSENFMAVDIKGISSVEKTSTSGLVDTYTITYSDGTTDTFSVTNGADGTYPDITASATADATSSANPSVDVTKTGTDDAPNFAFSFSGLKGAQGEQGPTGADGQDGQDGVSPEVTITTITGGHRITITDADHPSGQSFDVMDGSGGGSLSTLSDVNLGTLQNDQVLKYDSASSKWVNGQAPAGGHTMIPVSGDMAAIAALTDGDDNYVINAYSAKRWANCDAYEILTTAAQNAEGIGTWEADGTWESGSRVGWLWDEALYQILEDGNGNRNHDIEIVPVFDIGDSEIISLYAFRVDDDVDQTIDGVTKHGGAVAFKFNGKVQNANGVKVGVKLVHLRTEVNASGRIITA